MPESGLPLINSTIVRGCGTRIQHALYACIPTGDTAIPIERFILDPPLPWSMGHFRGPRLYERNDGVTDMILWIGQEHYPYVSDFIEEARQHGISRRVPISRQLTYHMLDSRDSRILLVHPRAIYKGCYRLNPTEPIAPPEALTPRPDPTQGDCNHPRERGSRDTYCAFAGWELSATDTQSGHEVNIDGPNYAHIHTPSVDYIVRQPLEMGDEDQWRPGIFAAFPMSHFEYVNNNGGMPERAAEVLGQNISITAVTYK